MAKGSISLYLLISFLLLITASSDIASDRAECTKPLMGLATCLPYVQGSSKAPTPDCCTGLKQVLVDNKKCLCVLIRDRDDPQLGIKLNATLALALPDTCKATANISHCPALLNMDPNSKEAAIFEQGGAGTAATPAKANSTSSSESVNSKSSESKSNSATSSILSYEKCFLAKLVVGFGLSIIAPLLLFS
ncbi:Bifunctional inhibitor/lipid-transfer protein/seed storage 2S albumin superfamily protein [Rhynchospora pubera]|uniref:Bifunctional inhibitor/lipid-transfer protein/seed storage 2S albumin superfamily protein n=1 Tax=Rhynchospora pubera TaxID=906938 RepID=A0AAV8DG49_9POAL|nr:Bifunctional inhibitor/lipid-transfer protein/seed storage 2S albumin superfamily protein [Rhynchospora pubera]